MASKNEKPASVFAPQGMLSLWAVLFTVWMVTNASLAVEPALTGLFITLFLAYAFAISSAAWRGIRWTPRKLYHFFAYSGTFLVELARANLNMMRYVYAPRIDIKPGIIKVRTRLTSPMGRLILANSIALTPGSLVMDIRGDILFVHLLNVETTDIDAATQAIVTPFEKHLEKVFG